MSNKFSEPSAEQWNDVETGGRELPQPDNMAGKPQASSCKAPRLEALNGTRWIASAWIVCSHFYGDDFGAWAHWGSVWTQFFFMLSGFALSYVEMARPPVGRVKTTTFQYFRKRMMGVYPTYIFAMLLTMAQTRQFLFDWIALPLNLTLMQSWLPWIYPAGNPPFPNLGVVVTPDFQDIGWTLASWQWTWTGWFLSVNSFFWLLLRPITKMLQHVSASVCIFIIGGCWVWSSQSFVFAWLKMQAAGTVWEVFIYTLWQACWPGYLHVFISGVAAARLFVLTAMCPTRHALDAEQAPLLCKYGCCLGYAVLIGAIACSPSWDFKTGENWGRYIFWFVHNGGVIPLMALIIMGAATGVDPIAKYVLQSKPMKVLADLSYAQYLLQFNVHQIVTLNLPGDENAIARKIVFPFALTAISFCTTQLFKLGR